MRWSTRITRDDIIAVEQPKRADANAPEYVAFARGDEPQLVLCLAQPIRVDGLFGTHKTVNRIGIYVDDVAHFGQVLDIEKFDCRYRV